MFKILLMVFVTFFVVFIVKTTSEWGVSAVTEKRLVTPDYDYEVDLWFNMDIYEFTPKSNRNKTCVVLNDDVRPQLQCFDKPLLDKGEIL